ncbi:MAG: hypothetical protein LAT57_03045 [Balneolales bacterium]|nr:hypothetical protein [Balneolales bacterium]
MRIFKFLGVFLIVTGLVYLVVFGLNFNVFKTVFINQEALAEGSEWVEKTYSLAGMADFIAEHPDLVSVVMLSSDPDSPHNLRYQPGTPRAMGATGHFIILLAYAEAIESGVLSSEIMIDIAELDKYQVPGHEPNRHQESIRLLTQKGQAIDGKAPIDAIVELMVTRNHQPSADFIFHTLGQEAISTTAKKWIGAGAEAPLPWSTFYTTATLVMPDYDTDITPETRSAFKQQAQIVYNQLDAQTFSIKELLPDDRKNGVKYTFFEEKSIYRLLPQVIPDSMAHAMLKLYKDDDTSADVRRIVLDHMRWPMQNTEILRDFNDVGAIYDSRIAVSSGVSFGESAYTGETFASVTFFDQLPVGFWMHMSSNLINQDFQLRLKFDPAMFERTSETLAKSQTQMN